jgi:pimeloyl-ACP methyl ester carboxylesterase
MALRPPQFREFAAPRLVFSIALLSLTGCITAPTAPSTALATQTPPASGERVDLGGYQLFLLCTGNGSPTVILEAGLNAGHTSWDLVQPALAQETRVCSYDRAGIGASDPGPQPRDSQQIATELHSLLANADIQPPYILVGHSFGALHIRRYAFQYPDEVIGLVFVDGVHEQWWSRASALLPPERPDDSERLKSLRVYLNNGFSNPASNAEGIDIAACIAEVGETGSFGQMPVVVLTAGTFNVLAPGLPTDVEAQLKALFQDELHGALAQLSTNSAHIVVPDSGHNMPQENPPAVVTAVEAILQTGP